MQISPATKRNEMDEKYTCKKIHFCLNGFDCIKVDIFVRIATGLLFSDRQ